ncbi:hypothetical protein QBK99_13260 [Corticibacterium sp. UT-5YL-CI-8]|nr:hypothetical protein [Tianweitania sp. UT-5YL-CI-8]
MQTHVLNKPTPPAPFASSSLKDLCATMGISAVTYFAMRNRGDDLPPHFFAGAKLRFLDRDIAEWIDRQKAAAKSRVAA